MNMTRPLSALLALAAFITLALASGYGFHHFAHQHAAASAAVETQSPKSAAKPGRVSTPAPGRPKSYKGKLPSLAAINVRNAVLKRVYQGFKYPWAMEFLSANELLVTEFGGRLSILDMEQGVTREISGLPAMKTGKGQLGLMDVALHPDFQDNGVIYLSHAVSDPQDDTAWTTAVTRAVLDGNRLRDQRRIFTATPYGKSPSNLGGALEFDDKGYLYIATGDRSKDVRAQSGTALNGKIIRLTADGEIPADNPFVDNPAIDDAIYALGIRNPQGLVFDRHSGQLYASEHGPLGGDEINRIEAGRNYGWPTITYGANYTYQQKGAGTAREGMEQPLHYYLPSIAVSPLTIYRGDMFPEWRGDLLAGALKSEFVSKLDLVDGHVISEHRLLTNLRDRVRDIKVASDGSVYLLLQRGGAVYRLWRDPNSATLEQMPQRGGSTIFRVTCASCHVDGPASIPQLDKPEDWQGRLIKGREALQQNTMDGVGSMPPRGLCDSCTDGELRQAVDYMLKKLSAQAQPGS